MTDEEWPEGLPRPHEMPEKAVEIYKEYFLISGHSFKGLFGVAYESDLSEEKISKLSVAQSANDLMDCISIAMTGAAGKQGEDEEERDNNKNDDSTAPVVVMEDENGGHFAIVRAAVTGIRCYVKVRDLKDAEEVRRALILRSAHGEECKEQRQTDAEFERITKGFVPEIPS